ncbi:hypothetical protein [Bradyrhizobium sp. Ash2021]|uniref:hypothetical protein n=1 Tax=Bradyrhizobium sp. Ash2021 TaxID=2954771 RepID=UPI0035BF9FF4
MAALDDFLDLVLAAWTERAFRNFFQHVVAADGFDEFLFGILAFLVLVVVMFLAIRGGMLIVRRGGVRFTGMLVGFGAAIFGMRRVVGVSRVFARMLVMMRVLFFLFFVSFRHGGLDSGRIGQGYRRQCLAGVGLGALVLRVIMPIVGIFVILRVVVIMLVRMLMTFVVMMFAVRLFDVRMFSVQAFVSVAFLALIGLRDLRVIDGGVFHHLALDAVAIAAAAGIAMARTAAMAVGGAVLALFLGLAMGALVGFDQRLTVGDRYLVIVGMDFAEGEEAVAVAAIFDEGCLQRWLYPRDLGEVDIAAQLFALGGLEIKFFDAIAADHNDPGLFRVGGIDQHLVGHFGALDGGGRGARRAHDARPGDATVHLIRG